MAGETRIIAFGSGDEEAQREEFLLTEEVTSAEVEPENVEEEASSAPDRQWLLPAVAGTAVAAWTGFFVWARQTEILAAPQMSEWIGLITDWAVPVLLICTVWLLVMRNSRREAARFGDAARVLSEESVRLETRLSTVNRELSLAREFIAAQSRDLEALGRIATERLSKNAGDLQDLIRDNSARIDTIGTVSDAALDNMEKLRGQLPVIASSAKDITNNIGNAGRTAHAQLAEMINGFKRLNEFGQASERQVITLRGTVDEAIAEFTRQCEHLDQIATERFAALDERGTEFRTQLDNHEVEALAAIRTRASALGEELEQTRQALDSHEAESLTSLRARLSTLRDEGAAISRAMREGESRAIEGWQASLERLNEDMAATIASLEQADSAAIEGAHSRLAALTDEVASIEERIAERTRTFDQEMERRRAATEANEIDATDRLSERLSAIDAEIERRRQTHEQIGEAIAAHSESVSARLGECERRLVALSTLSERSQAGIAAGVQALADRFSEARSMLDSTGNEVVQATDASVRLLELLQGSASMCREELQQSLAANVEVLASTEDRIAQLLNVLAEVGSRGESLSGLLDASEAKLGDMGATIEARQAALEQQGLAYETRLAELRDRLEVIEQQSDRLAEKAQGELSEAIENLSASVKGAVATISDQGSTAVSALAVQLGKESSAAIDKAMHMSAAETAGQLEQAAAHAAGVSREAAVQLRDQLAKVNELVGNLERRVAQARERAEEQVDNDFSRRVALITESLNSNSIDIARALSADVSDTAWASYLRGDRGIFTRRAVNLLESGEARAIAQIFENDGDFREHVSRYIHDFEAILRQVLSTRDGHALGVTLLSSDMGKLYVALAQSIERLRD
ncbi:MAG: ATPase [Novosphingobium sp.]|nr:ATPase [Novosphingobium sp.]MCP5402670.1 ATPase [Novosphingobium sp.]